jgi:radical SAM/Cys-rich protein
MHDTLPLLKPTTFPGIRRNKLEILQINIGLKCNLACLHCHVNSSPYRKEKMSEETIDAVISCLKSNKFHTLDITGGAPEMHPQFNYLVETARNMGIHVIDRCNLTILEVETYENLAVFLASNKVEIVASLPCYTEDNVDEQRGKGVFNDSINGLLKLNSQGYGKTNSDLQLNLVYNPLGAYLPPSQDELENTYKEKLKSDYGIEFNKLYTLCNMPIKRFGSTLVSKNQFENYITLLKNSHNDENLDDVMCKNLVSVDWEGHVYDCDFNQMLGLNINNNNKKLHISELMRIDVNNTQIAVADHCYGCTAGQGSSCGGALN